MSDPRAEIDEIISRAPLPPVILVIAPERIRRDRVRNYILEKFEKNGGCGVKSIRKNGKHVTQQILLQIREDLSTPSLFQSSSTGVIEDAHELPLELQKEIVNFTAKLPSGSSLVLLAEKLGVTSPLRKAAKGSTVELKELKGVELRKWVKRECLALGIKSVSDQCIQAILDLSDNSPDEATRIVQHLSLYIEEGTVSLKDIETLFPSAVHSSEFELLDAALCGNVKKILFDLRNLLRHGKSPFMLLGLLGRGLGTTISAKAHLDSGHSQASARTALNIPPWIFSKMLPSINRYPSDRRVEHLGFLIRADSKLKNLSLGEEAVMDEFLLSLHRSN